MTFRNEVRMPGRCRGALHLAWVAVLLAPLWTLTIVTAAQDPGVAPAAAEYIVGASDVLVVSVFNQPQLTGKYLVQADGTITFPLLGRIKVGGLAMQDIETTLQDGLAKGQFLKNPQVGVTVDQYRSQQILLMGELRQPGTLDFTGSMTLLTALARAGSTTDRAGYEYLVLRPRSNSSPVVDQAGVARAVESKDTQVLRADLERLQAGALTENLVLRGGDTVVVPKVETVFLSGQVTSPGEFPIRKGTTVRQLLSLAGGVTERGSEGRIQIIRKVNGEERKIDVEVKDTVQPGDTIVVRERLF